MWHIITASELFKWFPFWVIVSPVASMIFVVLGLKITNFVGKIVRFV